MKGWIAVDLDATLAEYTHWPKDGSIGAPIAPMVNRVIGWLNEGKDVRIFTARVSPVGRDLNGVAETIEQEMRIRAWCIEHIGQELPVTYQKDYGMIELWDDRCVQVVPNTGVPITS